MKMHERKTERKLDRDERKEQKEMVVSPSANKVRASLLITCKQLLETINLQTSYGLNKRKETKPNTQVYLFFGAMGHHALAGRSTSLSHLAMEELWLNGEDEWKRGGCGWLESQRVSRNPREA